MRILIADDEYWIREGLKNTLQEMFPNGGNTVVGEAGNGREMLEKIRVLHPEVVFVDIKMPVMDGLQAIQESQKEYQDIRWVILTGYSEFEYAKKAMKLGVQDYLLKPVEKQELKRVLGIIEQQRREERTDFSSTISRRFLDALMGISGPVPKESQMMAYQYQATVILYEQERSEQFSEKDSYEKLWEYCERLNEDYPAVYSCLLWHQSFFVLVHSYLKEAKEENRFFFQDSRFVERTGSDGKEGISSVLMPARNTIRESAADVVWLQNHRGIRFLCGIGESVKFAELTELMKGQGEKAGDFLLAVEELLLAYEKKSLVYFLERCTAVQDRWKRCQNEFSAAQEETMKAHLIRYMKLERFENGELPGKDFGFTLNYLVAHAQKILFAVPEKNEDIVDKALRIMMKSFADSISIGYIAEKLSISPNYLSALFHKKMGISFIQYLTQIRMEKAKELLQNRKISIQEAAEKTGYQNANYFSKVFREYYGMTPTEYQMHLEEDLMGEFVKQ
jgi:two-component system response regulator YesN